MSEQRQLQLNRLRQHADEFDCVIVGGGINGAVAAAALATRGARVALIDKADFASGTSQESSNLAWGGIKYLENFEIGLVRDLCLSRNELLRSYPSTVQEVRFLTTVARGFRHHPLMLWLGSWVYWGFGNAFTRPPRWLSRKEIRAEEPLVNTADFAGAIEYSDAYLFDNDARFVFGFIRQALRAGAVAANYVASSAARREGNRWVVEVIDTVSEETFTLSANVLINACGPEADGYNRRCAQATQHRHLLSKGVHLIVNRVSDDGRVLAFFADDGRLFFAIPMGDRTCLGTTDTRTDDPDAVVTDEDRDFILSNINSRLSLPSPLRREDIIAERCGVRPLVVESKPNAEPANREGDFLQLSRRHALDIDNGRQHITIYGGKLTDCINVGEEVTRAARALGVNFANAGARWYGEPTAAERSAYFRRAADLGVDAYTSDGAGEPLSERLWRRYPFEAVGLVEKIASDPTAADVMLEGTAYTRCELELVARTEMVVKLEDFLRRRSKLALMYGEQLRSLPGIDDVAHVLFGPRSADEVDVYFANSDA